MKKELPLIFLLIILSACAVIKSNPKYMAKTPKSYIVKKGDTLLKISKKFSISIEKIKKFNNLSSDTILIGQKLYFTPQKNNFSFYVTKKKIPKSGYHIVKKGETLPIIAVKYDVPLQELLDYNNLTSLTIKSGQKIYLKPHNTKYQAEKISQAAKKNNRSGSYLAKKNKKHIKATYKTSDYELPLKGIVTSGFGLRHGRMHKGIDIAAPIGTPIKAIADGTVVFSGVQNGYGNVIIISHKNNIMSVYAHNERNLVRINDTVKKGQTIATVGKTGRATGPHLHFEFRVNGRAINPKKIFNF